MDPIQLSWTDEEKEFLQNLGPLGQELLGVLPSGVHFHPHGKKNQF